MVAEFADIFQEMGSAINSDLGVDVNGSLLFATGDTKTIQRIFRRLLTNPGSYIWEPTYGAGLPRYVGQPLTTELYEEISALITSQILLEDSVANNPPPIVNLTATVNGLFCNLTYYRSQDQVIQTISFEVNN